MPPQEEYSHKVLRLLRKHYSRAQCSLRYRSPLQLLIATILSAQCTDERVNTVTPLLFKKYRTLQDYATADHRALELAIKSTGFYRNKARSIQGAARMILADFGGKVPNTMENLTALPGVARKTANVVLGNAFHKAEGVVVDTHVGRITQRIGFTRHHDPKKIEQDLMNLLPQQEWILFSHMLILHGRALCKAPTPLCSQCFLKKICPYPRHHPYK